MKVVLDTNIIVSGLLQSKGNPAQVLALALSGSVKICYDQRIINECNQVLARPRFKFDPKRVRDVMDKIENDGMRVEAAEQSGFGLPDADDEPFLAVAISASADFLVPATWQIIQRTNAAVAGSSRQQNSWSNGENFRAAINERQTHN